MIDRQSTKRTHKALIVEDNIIIRCMVADMMVDLGFEPILAADADAARTHLSTGTADLLIIDLVLGIGESGADLLACRSVELPPTVVLMSGNPEPDGLPTGTRYLGKPFTFAQLAAVLKD